MWRRPESGLRQCTPFEASANRRTLRKRPFSWQVKMRAGFLGQCFLLMVSFPSLFSPHTAASLLTPRWLYRPIKFRGMTRSENKRVIVWWQTYTSYFGSTTFECATKVRSNNSTLYCFHKCQPPFPILICQHNRLATNITHKSRLSKSVD